VHGTDVRRQSCGSVPHEPALSETRERTLALVNGVSIADLERIHSPLMSPLVWDLGHIAAFEDLWTVHRHGGRRLLHDELMDVYDAFETPRAERGELPFLRVPDVFEFLRAVRQRSLEVIAERGLGDGLIGELVVRHEQQHAETMLQTIALARLPGYALASATQGRGPGFVAGSFSGLELVEVPAGPAVIGASAGGFAYDNERPRHPTDVRGYRIGCAPITNGTYLTFLERGGYERREWWSDEGWMWKERHDVTRPGAWTEGLDSEWRVDGLAPLDPDRPVVHVSWFEADAFARAHGARLPTEVEWEKAATWDVARMSARSFPWGDDPLVPGVHANVDHVVAGPEPVGAFSAGASPYGCVGMIGDTWEWTSSAFNGYPGFVAHPYPEYSEVFFGGDYRVLRGGSWATGRRVAGPSFRNWDHPQRRQIFSGIRIATDL
jgi:iron(II)-dependent oxidoreductase